jgi:hypothetical protein
MGDSGRGGYLQLSREAQAALIDAARDAQPVRGLTHGYYKYPARFSPVFARAAIETFSKPGDLVLDPHVGGGTTLVEARASGREAVGVDISSLAEFVSNVKCTVYSDAELHTLAGWSRRVANSIDIHKPSRSFAEYEAQGYYKHLGHPSRWRFRKAPTRQRGRASNEKPPRVAARGFFGAAVPGEGGCRAANVTSPTANRSAVAGGCKRFTMLGFLVLALREHDRHEHQQKRSHEGRQQ